MAEMVKGADAGGMVHYLAWAQIVDVFFRADGSAVVVTTAHMQGERAAGQVYTITIGAETAEALRALLEMRAEPAGDVDAIAGAAIERDKAKSAAVARAMGLQR